MSPSDRRSWRVERKSDPIVLFIRTWPAFNTVAALAVNAAILVAVLIRWPPQSVFGG
jgi:hypothetical protein